MLYLFLLKLVLNDNSVPRNLKKKINVPMKPLFFNFLILGHMILLFLLKAHSLIFLIKQKLQFNDSAIENWRHQFSFTQKKSNITIGWDDQRDLKDIKGI